MPDTGLPKILIDETTRLLSPEDLSVDSALNSPSPSTVSTSSNNYAVSGSIGHQTGCDEEQGQTRTENEPLPPNYSNGFIARVVVALLIGVFTSSADVSLVIATHPVIASEFNDLENSSWLFISFMLAGAATQSLYGKLSDIYGRKAILLLCYALFASGCALIGFGKSMWQVILGRLISGSGGAGMMVLAAVIVAVGRSIGRPLGGLLADTIGWRWSFLGQIPIFVIAMVVCWFILPNLGVPPQGCSEGDGRTGSRLARIDFLGAAFLGSGLLALLLPLKIAGQKIPWTHPAVSALFVGGILLLGMFVITEARWAKEPIFPLRLLRQKDVVLSYVINIFQTAAQVAMMFSVPLYFQVTRRSSSTIAGAHLMPAVIGYTVGGIMTGWWIQRTGRYKAPLAFAGVIAFTSYLFMVLRWNGNTNWAESLYITPGGFGTGVCVSAVFILLQVAIDPSDKAAAVSGLYLAIPVGSILGMAASNTVMSLVMPQDLTLRLLDLGFDEVGIKKILKEALSRVDYIDEAPQRVSRAVVQSYIDGLEYSHCVSMGFAVLATSAALMVTNREIRH
ncbi:Uu.00g041190.m01.CDS01 [Anthostomella pinea]|uniref:Uu.00g041190.m01.CDS01 n=1 Tax=Anthostomella pinea TaxID=933095 RepID=A0AAI8VBD1_9PEZI|nr:Uu.00g041190.m01.CDS01 [Anthostomella pinea]